MGLLSDAVGALLKKVPGVAATTATTPAAAPAAAPTAAAAAPGGSPRDIAFVDAMVYAVAAKGELTDEDASAVAEAIAELPAFTNADDDALEALVDASLDRLEKGGWDAVLANLAAALPGAEDREHAFSLAVAVQDAAGEVDESEEEYISQLAAAFEYTDEQAQAIVDAVEAHLGDAEA
jgi:hypothetical protein